jgi:hypothetical protein
MTSSHDYGSPAVVVLNAIPGLEEGGIPDGFRQNHATLDNRAHRNARPRVSVSRLGGFATPPYDCIIPTAQETDSWNGCHRIENMVFFAIQKSRRQGPLV